MGYLDDINKKRQDASMQQAQDSSKKESIDAIEGNSQAIVNELSRQGDKSRATTQNVEVKNPDLAKTGDVEEVVDSINKLNITTFMAGRDKWSDIVDNMTRLSELMQAVVNDLNKNGVERLEKGLGATLTKLDTVINRAKSITVKTDKDVADGLKKLLESVNSLDLNPVVNVAAPKVEVTGKDVDLSPLETLLKDIKKQLQNSKVEIPKTDFSALEDAMRGVRTSIESLSFPVPNYILPYKDPTTGKATQVTLTAGGAIPVSATLDPTGIATDTNQTNGSQKTQIVDAGGEAVTVTGGKLDVNASVDTTGLATSAKQPALGTAGTASADVITVQGITSMTPLKTDGSAVTQPVSGTVTANAGTNLNTSALALDAHLTDKSQFTKLTDGTDTALITAAGEQNVIATAQPGVDIGDVTINNASGASAVNIQDGGNSITVDNGGTFAVQATLAAETTKVIGTVNQGTSPWVTSNATTSVVGNGTAATAQRVTLASDSTGQVTLATGANTIGALTANQSVNVAQMNGVTTSMGVGASGTGVQRVVLANDQGKTLVSASGSASSSGNNTLVAAGTNKLKVYAFSLSTTSTTALTVKFQSGAGGTDLWSVVLQAPTSVSTGANLVVQPPAWLFATASATLLNLNLSSANAVQWSVSYFDEA